VATDFIAPEARSNGVTYQQLLDSDTKPVPDVLRWESPIDSGPVRVPISRYTSQEFHDLEVEKVWKKCWQMACREEELAEVGDSVVYDIAHLSILVVRSAPGEIRAFHNVCLHRGRQLRECSGRSQELRCPFHGWSWNLDGSLKEIPARWDFPHVERDQYTLPEVKVATWGGFVFINMDPNSGSFEEHVGNLSDHFTRWPLEDRYKAAHVARPIRCNWKVAQEAFMEAYHVIATHPQLLATIGDANSQYDVWGNVSRAMTPNGTPSPHIDFEPSEQDMLDALTNKSMDKASPLNLPEGMKARALMAGTVRMQMQATVKGVHEITDAELSDSFYYTLFPNFHPWAAYNRITYRFRPWGDWPNECLMECMYLEPFRGKRPPPSDIHMLGPDDSWTEASELGFLARVFDQDIFNLPKVQRGLRAAQHESVTFAAYQETKIRHFHGLLEKQINA
jgi:phenylpropionate dioxygenase-like ring-hydroxylating dioxygenase large terminal subunit